MGFHVIVQIVCDRCGTRTGIEEGRGAKGRVRDFAVRCLGWRTGIRDGKTYDLCPECQPADEAERAGGLARLAYKFREEIPTDA